MMLRFASMTLIDKLLYSTPPYYRLIKYSFILLTWMAATLAIMQPEGNAYFKGEQSQNKHEEETEVIFLLDVSESMAVTDSRVGKSRLQYAKEIIQEIIDHLQGNKVSLYAFTSSVDPLVPETFDYLFTQSILQDVKINEGNSVGTNFVSVFEYIEEQLFTEPQEQGKMIILLSDGEDIPMLEGDKEERTEKILGIVDRIRKLNARFICIGMGSNQGGVIPGLLYQGKPVHSSQHPELLQSIAKHANGKLFLSNELTLQSLISEVIDFLNKETLEVINNQKISSSSLFAFKRYYQIPLLIAIFSLAYALLFPEEL